MHDDINFIKYGFIKVGNLCFDENRARHCETLDPSQNCMFGELTDIKWAKKMQIKFKSKQDPDYINNRILIRRKYESKL